MPATTVLAPDGTYRNDVFPFPTKVIQSVGVPANHAVIGLAKRYFMGIGPAKGGKLEYDDSYKYFEEDRIEMSGSGGILTGAFRKLTTFEATDSRNRFYKHFQEPMFSKVMKVLEVMDRISADRDNVPLSQIALNWCAQKEFVSSCIVGAQSRRKIEENCAAYQWMLTSEEIALLDVAIEQYLVEQ